jgi:hypothetical protein
MCAWLIGEKWNGPMLYHIAWHAGWVTRWLYGVRRVSVYVPYRCVGFTRRAGCIVIPTMFIVLDVKTVRVHMKVFLYSMTYHKCVYSRGVWSRCANMREDVHNNGCAQQNCAPPIWVNQEGRNKNICNKGMHVRLCAVYVALYAKGLYLVDNWACWRMNIRTESVKRSDCIKFFLYLVQLLTWRCVC